MKNNSASCNGVVVSAKESYLSTVMTSVVRVERPEEEQLPNNENSTGESSRHNAVVGTNSNNDNTPGGAEDHDSVNDSDDEDDESDSTTSHEHTITYKEIQYAINSFYAIVQPGTCFLLFVSLPSWD